MITKRLYVHHSKVAEVVDKYDLKPMGIGYDPHNADGFLHELVTFGCPVTEIRQSARR